METVACKKKPVINGSVTKKIIQLHNSGYTADFQWSRDKKILCMQDGKCFPKEDLYMEVVDQFHDVLSGSYKYIHIINTNCGEKGILIANFIFTTASMLLA